MIYYEVNLEIDPSIDCDFKNWLPQHIQEVLNLPGFLKANILEDQDHLHKITVLYELSSFLALENYFNSYASEMRKKTSSRFGDKVKANRRVLRPTKTLHSESL